MIAAICDEKRGWRGRGEGDRAMVRYIGVVLLATLVLWTGEASGACAWVLWGAQRAHEADTDARAWWVQAAYPTRQECEARRGVIHRRRAADDVSYECLPDTIDPRASKGAQ